VKVVSAPSFCKSVSGLKHLVEKITITKVVCFLAEYHLDLNVE